MYMYFLNHCFQAPTWCLLSLYKSQEAHLQYKRDTQVYKLSASAHHYPQWMILLVEAKWTPGGGEEFFLGLTNFHVATAVALLLIKLFLSLRLHFIITARCQTTFHTMYGHTINILHVHVPIRLLLILEIFNKFVVEHD